MKKILLILIISMSLIGCRKEINEEQLQNRSGIYYEINQETPYTGTVISFFADVIYSKNNYKNGKLNGKQIIYYETGQIRDKNIYKDGLEIGEWISYY